MANSELRCMHVDMQKLIIKVNEVLFSFEQPDFVEMVVLCSTVYTCTN